MFLLQKYSSMFLFCQFSDVSLTKAFNWHMTTSAEHKQEVRNSILTSSHSPLRSNQTRWIAPKWNLQQQKQPRRSSRPFAGNANMNYSLRNQPQNAVAGVLLLVAFDLSISRTFICQKTSERSEFNKQASEKLLILLFLPKHKEKTKYLHSSPTLLRAQTVFLDV